MNTTPSYLLYILYLALFAPALAWGGVILFDEFHREVIVTTSGIVLRQRKKRSVKLIELEFPQVVELFAILIGGGMSPSSALAHISERATGEFVSVLAPVVDQMKGGAGLPQALDLLNRLVESAMIRRFCDSLSISVERGTPLIDVVNRQVEEVRQVQRTRILERAGKAEIQLMIPVVFLVLPISVLFALWPSYIALGSGVMSG